MAIRGSLKEASLPDVIQLLFLGRRSGCLTLADLQRHGSIYFEEGWIIYAAIVNRRDRLGDMLLASGAVTRAQLDQALALQGSAPGRRIGELLVNLGLLSPEELRRFVRLQIEEAVYSLFSWTTGSFSFEAGIRPQVDDQLDRINPESLLLEGARRVDEWSLIEAKIPSFDLVFAVLPGQVESHQSSFTEAQRRLLPLLDGKRDVRQLIDSSGLSEFEAAQALYGLVTAGLAHKVGATSTAAPSRVLEARIEEHRNLGVAFYRTGMLEEASREFRRVAELRPSEGTAPFYLGLIAGREERWDEAADLFRQAIDRSGPRPALLLNLAIALERRGRLDQAETVLAEAASRAGADPAIQTGWGVLALERGEPVVARQRLLRARELYREEPPPALWYWAATRASAEADDLDAALDLATEGVNRHSGHPVLRNNLAVLLEATGAMAEAEAALRQLLAEETTLPQPFKNLGDLCYRAGRYDEAATHYTRAAALAPELGDDLYFKLGNLAFRERDVARARQCWERTLVLNPGHQLARANLDTLRVAR
jgi:tetratricopeptide (TPR) repeat protein